jgi:hypothetical protein
MVATFRRTFLGCCSNVVLVGLCPVHQIRQWWELVFLVFLIHAPTTGVLDGGRTHVDLFSRLEKIHVINPVVQGVLLLAIFDGVLHRHAPRH